MIHTLHAFSKTPIYVLAIWLALLLPGLSAWSQDPSFSQFYAKRIYLNPAFTGLDGGVAVSGAARLQWLAVDKGFKTYNAAVETQLPFWRVGLGLHLLHNQEGHAALNTTQAGVTFSYTIPGEKNNLHFGFEGRVTQKSIDWSKLVFSDQLDPVYGVVNPTAATPVMDQITFGDLDFGIVWRNEGQLKLGRRGVRQVRSHLGMSFHHLPHLVSKSAQGNDSFLNTDSKVAPRTTIHGGMIIPMKFYDGTGKRLALSPNFKLDMQGYSFMNFKENVTVGTFGLYGLVSNFYLGVFYQNKFGAPHPIHTDAIILTFGGYTNGSGRAANSSQQPRLFFGISADMNTTGVGPAAGSVVEATFRYIFTGDGGLRGSGPNGSKRSRMHHRNRSNKRVLDCKDFF